MSKNVKNGSKIVSVVKSVIDNCKLVHFKQLYAKKVFLVFLASRGKLSSFRLFRFFPIYQCSSTCQNRMVLRKNIEKLPKVVNYQKNRSCDLFDYILKLF